MVFSSNKSDMHMYLGKSDKDKDFKAKSTLGRFGLRPGIEHATAPWLLNSNDLEVAATRLKHICVPAHVDCNPKYLFSNPSRLKSHDWKQVRAYKSYKCIYTLQDIHVINYLLYALYIRCLYRGFILCV